MATKGTSHDRWKRKDWYTVLAPSLFNEALVGQVLASDSKELPGRTLTTTVYDLTNDMRKAHMKLVLEILNTDGKNCHTKINSFVLDNSYLRSLIRRRASKVEAVINLETKDEVKIRVKPIVITFQKCNTAQKQNIRSLLIKRIEELGPLHTFDAFLLEVISDKIPKMLKDEIRKIFPIKNVEIRRIDFTEKFGKMEEKLKKRAKLKKAIDKNIEKLRTDGKELPHKKTKDVLDLRAEGEDAEVLKEPVKQKAPAEDVDKDMKEAEEAAEQDAAEVEVEDREPEAEAATEETEPKKEDVSV